MIAQDYRPDRITASRQARRSASDHRSSDV
jgi:hypothetical protein